MFTRIIPVLTFKDQRMIKTIQFDDYYDVGDPVTTAKFYDSQDVDELILLDITASQEKRDPNFKLINSFTAECLMPLTIGGGITNLKHIEEMLLAGADKISINSYAIENPNFITEASKNFGSQCIVVSIDAKKDKDNKYIVYTNGGQTNTKIDVLDWVKEAEDKGAGEILINSIDNDGTMIGYDTELIKSVTNKVNDIPVIALGGAGLLQDIVDVYYSSNPSAIAMSSIFHFTDNKPVKANAYAIENGIKARSI